MKKILFIAIFSAVGCSVGVNAQIELRTPTQENKTVLQNPTENKDFNTNAVPFDEKVQDGPRMELNKFGVEQRRNLNIQQGNYNHYNQQINHNQHSIVGDIDRTAVNRPQSNLNNSQFDYNQNADRKTTTNGTANTSYNAPMQVKPMKQIGELATAEDEIGEIVEIGDRQNISINPEDGSATTPTAPGGDPNVPIGDAIPFLVLIAGIYAFILRRKQ